MWWIRRDARLSDNPALLEAQADGPAGAIFPWTPALRHWSGRRRAHLARVLWSLREDTHGAAGVRYGTPADVVRAAAQEADATVVWAQQDYSPSGIREQEAVGRSLEEDGRHLRLVGSPYAVAPGRVLKADGTEYQVFTPFRRAWRDHGWRQPAGRGDPHGFISLASDIDLDQEAALGDIQDPLGFPVPFTESAWLERLDDFVEGSLAHYAEERDLPAVDATSRMSIPLAHGQVHPRTLLAAASDAAGANRDLAAGATMFTSEVAWREFHADCAVPPPRGDPNLVARDHPGRCVGPRQGGRRRLRRVA